MKEINCYGIIPLKNCADGWQMLLIKHHRGNYWAFPKGHGEPGETAYESAERELHEETGQLIVRYLSEKRFIERYHFSIKGEYIHKTVTYFAAEVHGNLVLQKEEIQEAKWVPLIVAHNEISFKEGKQICQEVQALLKE